MSKQKYIWIAIGGLMRLKGPPTARVEVQIAPDNARGEFKAVETRPLLTVEPDLRSADRPWGVRPQGQLHLGDSIRIRLTFLERVSVSFFDLGTGGSCTRLYPDAQHKNDTAPLQVLNLPPSSTAPWIVLGPTTDCSRGLEILLAVGSRAGQTFNVQDLGLDPRGIPAVGSPRNAPLSGHELKLHRPGIFCCPPAELEYGMVVLEVRPPVAHTERLPP